MARRPTSDSGESSGEQLRRRVLYGLMLPASRLGFLFGTPLKELGRLLQMSVFHETRRRGLKTHEVAALLDVSARKVAMLSRQLKLNFLESEQAHGLPRRIEFMLWAEPLSAARIKQVLTDDDAAAVDAALEQLVEESRVRLQPGRTETYEVVKSQFRLVGPDWMARLDALENLMSAVGNAVFARFFQDEPRAFARTVSLRVRASDMDALKTLYEETIWPALVALDEAAHGDPAARPVDVSILWAPYEYMQRFDPEGDS